MWVQGFIYLFGTLCQRGLNDLKNVVSCIVLFAGLHDLNSARVVCFAGAPGPTGTARASS
ncbi:protein of unknown function [Pseudomonas sp. JV551A1]|uniref:Uncharacterized protein n=1 Tax=Pseudomonas inefficax TaxID=2078786 RepID=A0AAQ1PB87_9PSED|nr:protein of unknown function [Pseudomonas sp. JV551A1]SPO61145.1 protein of unknown function [Pseudomonas inefficax]